MIFIVCIVLVQLFNVALISKLLVSVNVVLLIVIKLLIVPVPIAARPIEVLSFSQLIVAVFGIELNVIFPVGWPAHTTTSDEGMVNVGGFGSANVISASVFDGQPFKTTFI
ncbi:MAG: hypothetical protein ACK52I_22470, partial [Pseudomonadota bacterium]